MGFFCIHCYVCAKISKVNVKKNKHHSIIKLLMLENLVTPIMCHQMSLHLASVCLKVCTEHSIKMVSRRLLSSPPGNQQMWNATAVLITEKDKCEIITQLKWGRKPKTSRAKALIWDQRQLWLPITICSPNCISTMTQKLPFRADRANVKDRECFLCRSVQFKCNSWFDDLT